MADGEIILGVDVDARQAEEKIQRLTNELAKLKINNSNLSPKLREIAQEAVLCEQHILRLKNALRHANDSTVISKLNREIQANEQYLKTLTNEYSKVLLKQQEIKSSIASINKEIGNIRKEKIDALSESHRKAEQAAKMHSKSESKLVNILSSIPNTISKISGLISRLTSRIFHLAFSAFVFNVISAGFRALSKELRNLIAQDAELVMWLNNVKANLMTAFYPIYQAALPALRALGQMLSWITAQLAQFIAMLTGTSVSANQQGAKQMYMRSALSNSGNTRAYNAHTKSQARANKVKSSNAAKVSKSVIKTAGTQKDDIGKSVSQAYNSAGKSAEDNAKKLAKFDKAATKSRKELAKFDKIDVLKQDKEKSLKEPKLAEVPDVTPFIPNMPLLTSFNQKFPDFKIPFLDNIISKFKEISNLFLKGFDFGFVDKNFGEILESVGRIKEAITRIFNDPNVAEGVNKALESIIYNIGTNVGSIASVGTTIGRLLFGGIANFFEQNEERIKKQLIRCFDITTEVANLAGQVSLAFANIFEAFGSQSAQQSLGNLLSGCESIIVDFVLNVSSIMSTLSQSFLSPFIDHQDEIKLAIQGLLDAIEPATNGIKTVFQDIADSVTSLTENSINPEIKGIGKIWDDVVKSIVDGWNKYISPVLTEIGNKFKEVMESQIGKNIKKVISLMGKFLNTAINVISVIWNFLKPFVKWLLEIAIDWFSTQFENMSITVMNIIGDISDLIGNISTILEGVIDFITGVFTGDWDKAWAGIGKIFDGFVGIIKTAINTLIDFINSMINAITGGINVAIRAINGVGFDLPDWLGGHHFGLNIPEIPKNSLNIPKLAQGSVLKGGDPFLAWVNDQPRGQTNIETPLDTIVRAFKEVAGNNGNQNIVIEANGDLGGIIRELNFRLKNENRRIGTEIMVPSGVL